MPVNKQNLSTIDTDSTAVLFGRLAEATEHAAANIKTLSDESKTHSAAIVAATKTLETIEKTVAELSDIVRDGNGHSLIATTRMIEHNIDEIHDKIDEISGKVGTLQMKVSAYDTMKWQITGGKAVVAGFVILVTWLVSISVSIYELFRK